MTQTEFEHKLIRMRPQMMRVAMDFFHNEEDAMDVVQEVYVRMLKRGWQQGDNVETLSIRATKNLCVSVWRRQRLREAEPLESVTESTGDDSADSLMLSEERQTEIENAIQKLPPSEQKLIRMRHQEDMTLEEIAQETGMTRRSASSIISSAKKHLLKLIKTHD
ncbi:MAG: sigma-70 family RNA polymerase sigma factor [Bacteroidaceae bacterium]|nr:sigma-70 family RNA polymerase sigma factor [Bacteroidaceae bacterium]